MPLSSLEFRENRCSVSDASREGVNEILHHIFYIVYQIWIKFSVRDTYYNLLSDTEFRKNRPSESHTLLRGVNKFIFVFSTRIARFE
jgi:hypothetical protein